MRGYLLAVALVAVSCGPPPVKLPPVPPPTVNSAALEGEVSAAREDIAALSEYIGEEVDYIAGSLDTQSEMLRQASPATRTLVLQKTEAPPPVAGLPPPAASQEKLALLDRAADIHTRRLTDALNSIDALRDRMDRMGVGIEELKALREVPDALGEQYAAGGILGVVSGLVGFLLGRGRRKEKMNG